MASASAAQKFFFYGTVCAISSAVLALTSGLAAISDLRVEQTLTLTGGTYAVTPALKISFNLSQSSPVTVKISRHLARYEKFKWPYLAKPILLRELNQGTMGAGSQTITWDGLDQSGQMVVEGPVSGAYTFTVTGDDGVRLFLNGAKVIDGWRGQGATPYTYSTTLAAGTLSDIELHYYEHEGDAACRLQWSYPGQGTQVIPQSQLFP